MARLSPACASLAVLAAALLFTPSSASAYLMDANDARVIEPGTLEFELQPIGYYQILSEPNEHYLVVPSLMAYIGLTDRADIIFLTRGFLYLDDQPPDYGQPRYRTYEMQIGFRLLVLEGAYSTDCIDGPSIVIQPQLLVPNIEAPGEVPGFSLAVLLAQQWEEFGTIHANVWGNRTANETWGTFLSIAYEGPPNWEVRPLLELEHWFEADYDENGDFHMVSGVAGVYIDVGDDFTWELGGRLGGWQDYVEVEARISMWFDVPLHPTLSDAEDDPCHEGGEAPEGEGSAEVTACRDELPVELPVASGTRLGRVGRAGPTAPLIAR